MREIYELTYIPMVWVAIGFTVASIVAIALLIRQNLWDARLQRCKSRMTPAQYEQVCHAAKLLGWSQHRLIRNLEHFHVPERQ